MFVPLKQETIKKQNKIHKTLRFDPANISKIEEFYPDVTFTDAVNAIVKDHFNEYDDPFPSSLGEVEDPFPTELVDDDYEENGGV